tara:strand:+ start:675 stop:1361 length:687 start_codon:yes stop_codon:yes gene_type:complete
MRCYNKNGLNITAASEGEAQWVSAFLNGEGRRLIIVPDGGSPIVVDMPSETVSIYSQDGKSVALAGKLLGGAGQQILGAAINNIDQNAKAGAKLAAQKRKAAALAKASDYERIIQAFEDQTPSNVRPQLAAVNSAICGTNLEYRVRMYQEIAANLVVLPENWRGILSWFQANVVPSDTTTHQKRKAFVTAVLRMGAVDNGVANSVKDTRDKNDAIDWSKYSDEDSCGS